jgi:hypothetical protein
VLQANPEKFRFEFDGTKLNGFPVPALDDHQRRPLLALARALDESGRELGEFQFQRLVDACLTSRTPLRSALDGVMASRERSRGRMVRWQEELDWLCYEFYGLLPTDSPGRSLAWSLECDSLPVMASNERPYRRLEEDAAESWIEADHVRKRLIKTNATLLLIEKPEFKRRWFRSAGAYDDTNVSDALLVQRALDAWLLERLEDSSCWPTLELATCARLADRVRQDADFMQVAELYRDRPDFDVTALVTELVESEAVPFLPVLRYKATGLRKRTVWERTWGLQREEDAGEKVGDISVPPKYTSADFIGGTFWRLRGKLDVPKERFVSYPHCERDADPTPVIAWAGWDHLQQAQALAAYYVQMKENEAWPPARLTPLLAGLLELLPWLKQWHNDLDPTHGVRLGDYFADFVTEEAHTLGLTSQQIAAWEPPSRGKRPGRKRKGS